MRRFLEKQIQHIQDFLNYYLDPELINDVVLPDNLLDPRTNEEIKDRFHFIYHKLIGPLFVTLRVSLEKDLTKTEMGFVAERVQVYLKMQGF
jgi:hypothetical protein